MIEFEVKAALSVAQRADILRALGAPLAQESHRDTYFRHPMRDFASTDEALRLREKGGIAELTYKGAKLDRETKTRREITTRIGDAASLRETLEALGFSVVAHVRKKRTLFSHAGFEVAVDDVEGLGDFLELERQLPDGADIARAKADAAALLATWGIGETERRSYLELLRARPSP